MGMFLSMSGIVGVHQADVANALKEYVLVHGGRFEPTTVTPPPDDALILCESHGNTTVVLPNHTGHDEPIAAHLSQSLNAPVFFFHVHDEDLWLYMLFVAGEVADQFYSMGDCFGYSSDEERQRWKGNAATISRICPHVDQYSIRNYLIQWDMLDEATRKLYMAEECPYEDDAYAHEDDEHPFGDCLQVVDFMQKLGFEYPLRDEDEPSGEAYVFELPRPKVEESDRRIIRSESRNQFDVRGWMAFIGAAVAICALVLAALLLLLIAHPIR
jgi:hypothetical protein